MLSCNPIPQLTFQFVFDLQDSDEEEEIVEETKKRSVKSSKGYAGSKPVAIAKKYLMIFVSIYLIF